MYTKPWFLNTPSIPLLNARPFFPKNSKNGQILKKYPVKKITKTLKIS
jgi:hypothetical protein